jgi:hypothetical protein
MHALILIRAFLNLRLRLVNPPSRSHTPLAAMLQELQAQHSHALQRILTVARESWMDDPFPFVAQLVPPR